MDQHPDARLTFRGCELHLLEEMGARSEHIMAVNRLGYNSGKFNAPVEAVGVRRIHMKHLGPWQNGRSNT